MSDAAKLAELTSKVKEMDAMVASVKDLIAKATAEEEKPLQKETVRFPFVGEYLTEVREWNTPLDPTAFNLLFMCPLRSYGFWYGIFVYAFQMATISLTLFDIVDSPKGRNPLRIPPMVDLSVTLAQKVAIVMALAFQSDFTESARKVQNGFFPKVTEQYPGVTFKKWLFSCMAQLLAGLLLLTVIFILTMQAEDVISIMLNFAALHFMAEIDYCGFKIAKLGFVHNKLQKEILAISEFTVPKRLSRNRFRRFLFYTTLAGLFLVYGQLKALQFDGEYLPTQLHVQFQNAHNKKMPRFSGTLSCVDGWNVRERRRYSDTSGHDKLLLAYCKAQGAWTFSLTNDPCDYFAKSYETSTYDVTSVHDSEWKVVESKSGELQPFGSFNLHFHSSETKSFQVSTNSEL